MSKLFASRGTLAILVVLAFSFLAVAVASADTMDTFTISGPGGYSDVFTLPASPTSANTSGEAYFDGYYFDVSDVTMNINGTTYTDGFAGFYLGGFADAQWFDWSDSLDLYGSSQVFSGTVDAPTFVLGDYSYIGHLVAGTTNTYENFTLAIANASPVPEPPTLLLLGSGLIGLIGLGLFRRREIA